MSLRFYRTILLTTLLTIVAFVSVAHAQTGLNNPLNSQFSSIPLFIAGALKALALIALPIITLFLVISGFLFITAQGNEQKLATAKKNFFYVIIGALLILGAWIIATLIAGTVTQLTGSGQSYNPGIGNTPN
ncbi:hypothetical protein A2853_00930 [Candidatus Kaiserbacteria bacterium RIFCSPHIGHO2_01_FULL_55_17]|uniref:Uncharacterized protein n=1 Tax=Candidatus Kaiserbacteria bacterium RIFCSPHIGHO2_01_FULL_55_17 TaxID=1798484 RepID=A0A1F6DAJ1_9BACT|nr:MAG: hypothetical protein A2853_00930 [Candidatus Kaiserbacteria bacterium RIFCSPHIGHO2_01_FULL_55_17]